MADLSRGITFQTNSHVTQAMLHALIDTAIADADAFPGTPTLYDIVMSDLLTVRAFGVENAPSSPATNDLTVGSDGLLDRYNGSAWTDATKDVLYLLNNAAVTLATGNPVVGDPTAANKCKLWDTAGICYEPLGVCESVAAVGATATIQIHGDALVRVNNPATLALDVHLRIGAAGATQLSISNSSQSDVLGIVVAAESDSIFTGICIAALTH